MEDSLEFLPESKPGSVLFQDHRVGSEEASGRQCGLVVRKQAGQGGVSREGSSPGCTSYQLWMASLTSRSHDPVDPL